MDFANYRDMGNVMDSLKNKVKEMEREEIINALRECNWIMARAARRLGITERMIGYKVRKYGIRVKEVRWVEDSHQSESNQ
jgi:Nif-specific regulatory protein